MKLPRVLITYTGGTIGMYKTDRGLAPLSAADFEILLRRSFNSIEMPVNFEIVTTDRIIDSTNASFPEWAQMGAIHQANYRDFDGFITIVGTDTIDYCSAALSLSHEGLAKPIIVTGSMSPLSFARSDALGNLTTAYLSATNPHLRGGVYTAFNHKLVSGAHVAKVSDNYDGVITPHFPVLGEMLPSGLQLTPYVSLHENTQTKDSSLRLLEIPQHKVFLIPVSPGNSPMLTAFLKVSLGDNVEAMIIEGYGNGNLPQSPELEQAIIDLINNNVPVIIGTTVIGGVSNADYAAGSWLDQLGVLRTGTMTRAANYIKTNYLLGHTRDLDTFSAAYSTDIRGETLCVPSVK